MIVYVVECTYELFGNTYTAIAYAGPDYNKAIQTSQNTDNEYCHLYHWKDGKQIKDELFKQGSVYHV